MKEWCSVQWREPEADHITSDALVHHPLICYTGKAPIDFKNSASRGHHDNTVACSMKVSVEIMILQEVQRHVYRLQEVSLHGGGGPTASFTGKVPTDLERIFDKVTLNSNDQRVPVRTGLVFNDGFEMIL
jgi:hypothetical protein